MSIYLLFLLAWVVSVGLSVSFPRKAFKVLAGASAVGLVFVAPGWLVVLKVVPGWGFGVLSLFGYVLYWLSDVLFESSPYEGSKAA